jgi:hypothetical protein
VDIDRVAEVLGEVMENLKSLSETLKLGDLASNFVADSGANIATQALSGQKVTLGADFANGALDAGGTVAGGAALGKAGLTGATLDGAANFAGGVFQSEAGGLAGVQGDSAYELPTSGKALSTDGQNLEGALFDGLGGVMAHGAENPTATSGQMFTITDTLGNLTDGSETSGTSLKQTLASLEGKDGAMPAA